MTKPPILRFILDDGLRQSAAAGQHNFIGKIAAVAQRAGYHVEYVPNTVAERLKPPEQPDYTMVHMLDPPHERALTMRRVYHYPFWAIESSAKRWQWRVAQTDFPAPDVSRKVADRFYKFWQNRLFGDAPQNTTRDGFVFVPLQGRLLDQRSFQTCSPLEMLHAVLVHDPARQVIAALHPNEHYSAPELSSLNQLVQDNPRLSMRTGDMNALLGGCDYVVTQNSAAAFNGYFFGKPAVLFAKIDFHHIAANVSDLGIAEAMQRGPEMAPDYAGYLHWFWQIMSINAGRPEAEEKIRDALLRAGWPM